MHRTRRMHQDALINFARDFGRWLSRDFPASFPATLTQQFPRLALAFGTRTVSHMPNFVEFSRQDSRRDDEPMFTLQTRGLVSMNQAAFKALGEPGSVALLYDTDEGIVALRKVARTYPNGYTVRKQGTSNSYLVGAQGFTSFNKIPCDVSRRFVGHEYASHTWGFELAEGVEIKNRSSRRAASDGDKDGRA
jgi:hypothetical protein